ncbi:MAG: SPASM domain-containing protein [Bdellovibrionales bacterium]|nr:SPASM domain-containing protein [Bdellovibrionales bacterium]
MEYQTHCSRLWNGLMIRPTGLVFPCCAIGQDQSLAIGDIRTQSLTEIVNSEKIKQMRRDSIAGKLACYANCNLQKYFQTFPVDEPLDETSSVEKYRDLEIEFGETCNVDCVMCWQRRDNHKTLVFEELIENLPIYPWKKIVLYGGEILVMKEGVKFFNFLKENKTNLYILTNGKVLNSPQMAQAVVDACSGISISINAVSEQTHNLVMRPKIPFFHTISPSIKKMKEYASTSGKHFECFGKFTAIVESLFEIPIFIRTFREMGFDQCCIDFDHRHFPQYFVSNPDVTLRLANQIRAALDAEPEQNKVVLTFQDYLFSAHAQQMATSAVACDNTGSLA